MDRGSRCRLLRFNFPPSRRAHENASLIHLFPRLCAPQSEGVKSKRHMKQMLAQMKASRVVTTVPLGAHAHKKGKQFGYLLAENKGSFQRHRAENPHGVATPASQ